MTEANGAGSTPQWIKPNPIGTPPDARFWHVAGYSPASNRMVMATGRRDLPTFVKFNDVWVLTNANANCISVSIPNNLQALRNTTLTVPVNVTDTTDSGVLSFDFTLNYDPAVLTPLATPFDTTGTLASGFTVTVNSSTPGTLIVSGFGSTELAGAGTLLNLKFTLNARIRMVKM